MDINITLHPFQVEFVAGRIEIYIRYRRQYHSIDYLIHNLRLPFEVEKDRYVIRSHCSNTNEFMDHCYEILGKFEGMIHPTQNPDWVRTDPIVRIESHYRGFRTTINSKKMYHFNQIKQAALENPNDQLMQETYAAILLNYAYFQFGNIEPLEILAKQYPENEFIQSQYNLELKLLSFVSGAVGD